MSQDFAATFQTLSNWAMTLPEPPPEKQLTEEEEKFLKDFDDSVERGEPFVCLEDKEMWSDMLEETAN
ncbi:MAG TPA: hypothetical protein ENI23_11480 [bacterium]|nr:hypothetical protein [bacterium]